MRPGWVSALTYFSPMKSDGRGLIVRGLASQTDNLIEWMTSGTTTLGRIDKNGYMMNRKTSAPADADLANNDLAIWSDDTNVNFKKKTSTGTIKTAVVALV
jgi:hypothetical protein